MLINQTIDFMTHIKRREFLKQTARAGVASCALLACSNLNAFHVLDRILSGDEVPDPLKLNYCGYKCPEDCQFRMASEKNDVELKKEAYKNWAIKERFGVEFDAEKIFCFGCKNEEMPEGVVLKNCTVRKCAIEKGVDCCIECDELADCKRELWDRFPDFKLKVIEMQKTYMASLK